MTVAGLLRHAMRRDRTPFVILAAMVVVMAVLPAVSHYEVRTANVFNVMQNFAALGLVALALGITIIAGEFDLSVTSMYLLGGMVAVLTGTSSPAAGVFCALAVALAVGLIQGGLVAGLRLTSMPVTLGGYLILLGVTYIIGHNASVSYPNYTVGLRLDEPILEIFSLRSLIAVAIFVSAALAMHFTRLGRDIRAVGGDRRASRIAGVRVGRILIGVFVIAALLTAFSGSLLSYSLATASPTIALDQLTFSATAALLGGVSLTGGRGSPVGIAAGVISLSILQELLSVVAAASFVQSLVTGALLLGVTIVWAPELSQWLKTVTTLRAHEEPSLSRPTNDALHPTPGSGS
jgi:ribose transport system permease protein